MIPEKYGSLRGGGFLKLWKGLSPGVPLDSCDAIKRGLILGTYRKQGSLGGAWFPLAHSCKRITHACATGRRGTRGKCSLPLAVEIDTLQVLAYSRSDFVRATRRVVLGTWKDCRGLFRTVFLLEPGESRHFASLQQLSAQ